MWIPCKIIIIRGGLQTVSALSGLSSIAATNAPAPLKRWLRGVTNRNTRLMDTALSLSGHRLAQRGKSQLRFGSV